VGGLRKKKSPVRGENAAGPRIMHLNTARDWRGGERQVLNLALALRDLGVEQLVVCPPNSDLSRRLEENNLPWRAVYMGGELDPFAPRRLEKVAREFQADIVHAHTARAHAHAFRLKKRMPELKLVVSRRVDFPVRPNYFSRKKYLSPLVDRYIAISRRVREVLIEDGISPEKIGLVYSALDYESYASVPSADSLRLEFSLKNNELLLANVAALTAHKDQKTLLSAIALLPEPGEKIRGKKFPEYRFFILGEGELREALTNQAKASGLLDSGRLIFTGFRSDALVFYRLIDVYVMSSSEEGLGTAVLDALAFGLPVVSTAGGGIPEMVDPGKGGLLSPVGDPEKLAENLTALMLDPAARRRMGAYNLKKVKQFGISSLGRGTLENYRLVLESTRGL